MIDKEPCCKVLIGIVIGIIIIGVICLLGFKYINNGLTP